MDSREKDRTMMPAEIEPNKTYICINDWKDSSNNVIAESGKLYGTSKSHCLEINGNFLFPTEQEFRIHFEEIELD